MINIFKFIVFVALFVCFKSATFAKEADITDVNQESSYLTRIVGRARISALYALGEIKWSTPKGIAKIKNAKDLYSLLLGISELASVPLKGIKTGLYELFLPWRQKQENSRNVNFVCPIEGSDNIVDDTKEHVLATYQMMKDINEAFVDAKAEYFAICGTLLGSVRNRGFLRHDDDLDLAVTTDFEQLMPNVLANLQLKGYRATLNKGMLESLVKGAGLLLTKEQLSVSEASDVAGATIKGWRVERIFDKPRMHGKETFPFCDIFLMRKIGDRYYYDGGWPTYSIHESGVYPLQKGKFGDLTIAIPNKPYLFLDAEYQDSWSDHIKKYNHGHGNRTIDLLRFTAKLERMSPEDYLPAGPFGPLSEPSKVAVILAAGMGKRMGEEGVIKPKGFIEYEGLPLIKHSLQKLKACGVTNTIIVTGHQSQFYEALAKESSDTSLSIKCCYNDKYPSTGTMHSFYRAKELLEELNVDSFLLLESDIIYPQSALEILQKDPRKNVLLATSATGAGDEVYIEANSFDSRVQNISKSKEALKSVHSEFVCITKFSMDAYQKMCDQYEADLKSNSNIKAEYGRNGIVNLCKQTPFYVLALPFEKYPWTEIDTPEQQERAHELVSQLLND